MEGISNDFVITHGISETDIQPIVDQAVTICDRRRGIGADGIIFVLPSKVNDFKMRIFNSDGSEAEMCGNGIRCFTLYIKALNLSKLTKFAIETLAGVMKTEIIDSVTVRVNMGKPILYAPDIPVATNRERILMHDLQVKDKTFKINAVSMGNPHAVIYTDALTDEMVLTYGPLIEKHPLFPKKINVEFIKVLSNKEIQMRVWERGCGETQACGTGACASVVSGIINKLHDNEVTVHLPGGDLCISWAGGEEDPVMMTGPARRAFTGTYKLTP